MQMALHIMGQEGGWSEGNSLGPLSSREYSGSAAMMDRVSERARDPPSPFQLFPRNSLLSILTASWPISKPRGCSLETSQRNEGADLREPEHQQRPDSL